MSKKYSDESDLLFGQRMGSKCGFNCFRMENTMELTCRKTGGEVD